MRACLARERATGQPPGRYQLLAAINAVHTDAREARDTDWSQVAALYDQLVRLDPSPIVRLNRAVAIAELDGPAVALAEVDRLPLEGYHAWHATRADLLRRLGRAAEARAAYDAAIAATGNAAEQAWLARRRDQLAADRLPTPARTWWASPSPGGGRIGRQVLVSPLERGNRRRTLVPRDHRRTIAIYRRQSKNIAKHREESWDTDSGATSGVAPDRGRSGWGGMPGGGPGGPPWAQGHRGRPGPPPWLAGLFGLVQPEPPRGPRVKRGDVRAAILDVVAVEPLNGYQVIQQIAERTGGQWKPSPGSVYPTISQLEDEGLLVGDDERGRTLRLTEAGEAYVAEHPEELAAVWAPFEELPPEEAPDLSVLKNEVGQLMSAVWQILSNGTDEQRKDAMAVLIETRRKLYGLLADEDPR